MKSHWTTFLVKFKRWYAIVFETRDIEIVRHDYFSNKWISKEELNRLLQYEEDQFVKVYQDLQNQYNEMLSSFNLNSFSSYSALERNHQSKLKK